MALSGPATFLTAQWRDLLMLNFAVDPALLAPHVPAGTTLDRWEGEAIVSIVGFRFADTRVLGISVPGHRDFEEVNLRFYVSRRAPEGVRRAVVFLRELVPRPAIAWMARFAYNEPYRALPMRHEIAEEGSDRSVLYEWQERGTWTGFSVRTSGPSRPLEAGSEEEFITEHFWGYTRQRDGGTVEYEVKHPSWNVWRAEAPLVTGAVDLTYGPAFGAVLRGAPRSAFVADGSAISVHTPRRLTRAELAGA